MSNDYDVVVLGSGNAANSAALSACENGARVIIVEKAPFEKRGGNTRFTQGFRFVHSGKDEILELVGDVSEAEKEQVEIDGYSRDQYYNDLMRVTEGLADPELTEITVENSNETVRWLIRLGVKWEIWSDSGVTVRRGNKIYFHPGTCARPKGGGAGLVEMQIEIAEKNGVEVVYDTRATELLLDKSASVVGVKVCGKEGFREIYCKAVVMGCGGFEASPEMRTRYLGQGWDIVKVRGTRYNTGDGLNMALAIGAQPYGQWSGCHCSVIDANSPPVEAGISARAGGTETKRYGYPFGIMVNSLGKRFLDEGEDFQTYTYAKYGRVVLSQPYATAYQIFDDKVIHLLPPAYNFATPINGNSIEEIAENIGLEKNTLMKVVDEFNRSVKEDLEFDPGVKDGKCTEGIEPQKTNWATKIDKPPFVGYAVTGGITFSFGGIKINKEAQVIDIQEKPIRGLYATGEMTGGFYYYNYAAGSGLCRGSVFGRIAGARAAKA